MFSISKRYVDNSKFLSAVPADTKSGNFVSAIRRHIFVDISFAMLKSMMGAGHAYASSGVCVEQQQWTGCVSTLATLSKILRSREVGSISTLCSVSSNGKVHDEDDTRLGR